jgi:hypothetical protein
LHKMFQRRMQHVVIKAKLKILYVKETDMTEQISGSPGNATASRPGSTSAQRSSLSPNCSRNLCCIMMPTPVRAAVPLDHKAVVPGTWQ